MPPHDYTTAIADAARAFIEASMEHSLMRTDATEAALAEADNRLHWMVEAEKHGWDPARYTPDG
ncbi:MAG: hypothetical protein KGL39_28910 [Patescibacteria group bacterium]|nr:hypothetical protein [Patescibacteria group bacterium]